MNNQYAGKIKKLPKWAQEYIETLERDCRRQVSMIQKLHRAEQEHKPDWHEHEFTELVHCDGIRYRYICANNVILNYSGVEVEVRPDYNDPSGGVVVSFGISRGTHDNGEKVSVFPQASNVVRFARVKEVKRDGV